METLLTARRLRKTYAVATGVGGGASGAQRVAVDDVSFDIFAGETLALVGESGCGKTTLARLLLRLVEPDSGEITFRGRNWLTARGAELRGMRREMQMVFQDPFASLNPRMRVGTMIGEPLEIHEPRMSGAARREKVAEALGAVGLPADAGSRYPHEFSGGQRQRIGIARALVLRPALVVADEPVSSLDVSVGAQILELLRELQRKFSLTYLLISHSLPVVSQLATRVAVMHGGKIVEMGEAEQVLWRPQNEYTRELIAAVPEAPDSRFQIPDSR